MRARTTSTTGPAPRYGVPTLALLARADRGYARFLAQQTEDQTGREPSVAQARSHPDDTAPARPR